MSAGRSYCGPCDSVGARLGLRRTSVSQSRSTRKPCLFGSARCTGSRLRTDDFLDGRLQSVSREAWLRAIEGARSSQNAAGTGRGTLDVLRKKGVRRVCEVSPHIHFAVALWGSSLPPNPDRGEWVSLARSKLEPLHDFRFQEVVALDPFVLPEPNRFAPVRARKIVADVCLFRTASSSSSDSAATTEKRDRHAEGAPRPHLEKR